MMAQASSWNNTPSSEELLSAESIESSNLFITGIATIDTLSITNSLSLGTDTVFQINDNSLNSLSSPLKLQSLALAPLEIMAGKITIDTDGNATFNGSVDIAGNLNVSGNTTIKNVAIENLVVASNSEEVTNSAEIVEGQINTNSVAGKAILLANKEQIKIVNNKVKQNTLVYVTPITSTENKVLYVKTKGDGYFEIGFDQTISTDVEFNWWIIELGGISE